MVDTKILRKAQLKMVDILLEFDRICKKYDIEYWISYGTLLGAVRHKGFIPWDDDCDICMMRNDYNKFMEIASKELPDNLIIQNHKIDPYYPGNMTKIRMKNTKFVEYDESENERYHQGIFIDIFIFDYYPSYVANILNCMNIINRFKTKRTEYPKGSVMRIGIQVLSLIPYALYTTIAKVLNYTSIPFKSNSDYKYIGLEVNCSDRKYYDKSLVFPLKRQVYFEGYVFNTPYNHEEILRKMYGDYMVLPKPNNRRGHARYIEL